MGVCQCIMLLSYLLQGEMNGGLGGGFGRRPHPPMDELDMPMGARRVMPG